MYKTGIASVSFRGLADLDIINLAKTSGVDGIEWGGDVHVPAGDTAKAKTVRRETESRGLEVLSYGSYYSLGSGASFRDILETARELGAPVIRIWAGNSEKARMTKEQYAECIDEARRISMAASADGVSVAFEYHNNSLTSNACDAVELINDIGRDNIRLYWQTEVTFDTEKNMEALKAVLPYLINIHVFNYSQGKQVLLDEADGADSWSKYMSLIKGDGKNHNFLTEFSKDGLTDSFIHDAAVLKGICRGVYGE